MAKRGGVRGGKHWVGPQGTQWPAPLCYFPWETSHPPPPHPAPHSGSHLIILLHIYYLPDPVQRGAVGNNRRNGVGPGGKSRSRDFHQGPKPLPSRGDWVPQVSPLETSSSRDQWHSLTATAPSPRPEYLRHVNARTLSEGWTQNVSLGQALVKQTSFCWASFPSPQGHVSFCTGLQGRVVASTLPKC